MRICQHDFPENYAPCRVCGLSWAQASGGMSCIWRDVADAKFGRAMPEPTLRVPACEDAGMISARMAELAKDRAAAMNATEPPPAAPSPGAVDPGDCCV